LLTLARVEHVPSSLFEPVDRIVLVRDVAGEFGATRPEVRIAVTEAEARSSTVMRYGCIRLLTNVVENAVRHRETNVSIEVAAAAGRATIAVDDDGTA